MAEVQDGLTVVLAWAPPAPGGGQPTYALVRWSVRSMVWIEVVTGHTLAGYRPTLWMLPPLPVALVPLTEAAAPAVVAPAPGPTRYRVIVRGTTFRVCAAARNADGELIWRPVSPRLYPDRASADEAVQRFQRDRP